MPEYLTPQAEQEESQQEIEQVSPSALAILNQSEHAAMVQTANLPANRRKLADFDSRLMAYANHSQPIALLMFYSLPRAGKQVIGPSVRFAEIVAPCWKNCAVGSRVIGDSATTVTAQGIFLDYEANLRNSIEVPRRITGKEGNRYSDDMVISTSNAAMSVARRNAVLKGGVPQALWTPAYDAAQLTAVGKATSHSQRVADAMEYLYKLGLTEWQILNAVGQASIKDLETEHLVTLRVLCAEIKRGDKTIEEVFGSPYDKEIDSLFAQLKLNTTQQAMHRNSYAGRAEALLTYLRERVGGRRPEPKPEPKPEPRQEARPEPPTPVGPVKTTQPAEPEPPVEATEPESGLESGPEPSDTLPAWSRVSPPVSFATPASHPAAKPQTSMEPPRRGRGRPTREELARREAAAAQGTLLSQEPVSEEQARREVEDMVVKSDEFVF